MPLSAKTLTQFVLVLSSLLWGLSFFQKDRLPDKAAILPNLYTAPIQTETQAEPFQIERNGVTYQIKPMHDYELYGMVVSENDFRHFWDRWHEDLKDYINIKDLCVIWGPNIESEIYKNMKFRSGEWTCYWNYKTGIDRALWSQFQPNALSNNHLLSEKNDILAKVKKSRKGDQIHFKGYLVEYKSDLMYRPRTSSTTREDNGCEVVYLTQFEIHRRGNRFWNSVFSWSGRAMSLCIVLLISYFLIEIGKVVRWHSGKA